MNYKISIIIPIYNTESYLHECLESIIKNKKYNAFEVLCISDKSPNNTIKTLGPFLKKYKNIKYIENVENLGLGATRNKGIRLATGEYIFFLDSDDTLPPNSLDHMLCLAEKYKSHIVTGKIERVLPDGSTYESKISKYAHATKQHLSDITEHKYLLWDTIACNKLFKTSFLSEIKFQFEEGKLYEDMLPVTKALSLSKSTYVTEKKVYFWRLRNSENAPSISEDLKKPKNMQDRFYALNEIKSFLKTHNKSLLPELYKKVYSHDLYRYTAILHNSDNSFKKNYYKIANAFLNNFDLNKVDSLGIKTKLIYFICQEHSCYEFLKFISTINRYNNNKIKTIFNLAVHYPTPLFKITISYFLKYFKKLKHSATFK